MSQLSLQLSNRQKATAGLALETNPPVALCSARVILSLLLLAAVTVSPYLVRATNAGPKIPSKAGPSGTLAAGPVWQATRPSTEPAQDVALLNMVRGKQLADSGSAQQRRIDEAYGRMPLSFEANEGQTDPQVCFLARGSGYTLFLTTSAEAVLVSGQGQPQVVRLELTGANPRPEVGAFEERDAKSYYFVGNDPTQWRTQVAHYGRVRYAAVYPGIDLVYYGNGGQLEYDWVVAHELVHVTFPDLDRRYTWFSEGLATTEITVPPLEPKARRVIVSPNIGGTS